MTPPILLNPGHTERPVTLARLDGRDVIHKRYRDDGGRAVHRAMVALWNSPFGAERESVAMPEPLAYDPETHTLTMTALPGDAVAARGDLGSTSAELLPVARLLADLHSSGVQVDRRRDAHKLLRSLDRKLTGREDGLLHRLAALAPGSEQLCPNHGDFSPRNVLAGATGPALIDFDRIQMAGPGRDVQYLAAWCWVTAVVGGADPVESWELGDRFEAAYLAHRPHAAADIVAGRAFHRASGLVRIATEWSSMKSDPAAARTVLDEAWRFASASGW
ncbi:MAG: aminoglycoside phosphotransferase family protein [Actinobacteria bacterium]|nr:aminoglycoside phosphotransferase family protein [Actinomycetota bacterium]